MLWSCLIEVTAWQHQFAKGPEGRSIVLEGLCFFGASGICGMWKQLTDPEVFYIFGVIIAQIVTATWHMEKSRQWTSWSALNQDHCRESAQRSTGNLDALPSCEKDASRQHGKIQTGHDFQLLHLAPLLFGCGVKRSRFVMWHLIHGHLSSLCWQHFIFQIMAAKCP